MNRLQNIQIEIWKYKVLGNTKYNQDKLVLAVFFLLICANIALNYIKQT